MIAWRPGALAVTLAGCLLGAASQHSGAADLPRLHVRSFVLAADRNAVKLGERFHLMLTIVVDERIDALDRVVLPDLGGFDVYGDERQIGEVKGRSRYVETLTLASNIGRKRLIQPAHFDAINASNNRASRFFSNTLVLAAGAYEPHYGKLPNATDAAFSAAVTAAVVLALAGLVFIASRRWWRKPHQHIIDQQPLLAQMPRTAQAGPRTSTVETGTLDSGPSSAPNDSMVRVGPGAPQPVVPMRGPALTRPARSVVPTVTSAINDPARWRTILDHLAERPTRARVFTVRAVIRERAGARDDETFGDLVARHAGSGQTSLVQALRAIERAAFIDDQNLPTAVHDAIPALERLAEFSGR